MQHHADLTLLVDAHLAGVELVVDLVDDLDFGVVIARTQRAQLLRKHKHIHMNNKHIVVACNVFVCRGNVLPIVQHTNEKKPFSRIA